MSSLTHIPKNSQEKNRKRKKKKKKTETVSRACNESISVLFLHVFTPEMLSKIEVLFHFRAEEPGLPQGEQSPHVTEY